MLLAGERVDALSLIVHTDAAYDAGQASWSSACARRSRASCSTSRPGRDRRQRVIARETVKALRKDVTAKLYGGDVTRKKKLLEKQKKGKKRMKQVGARRGAPGGLPRRCCRSTDR